MDQLFEPEPPEEARPEPPPLDGPLAARMRPRDAGRVRRPGAPARRGLGAAHRDRVRPAALDGPLRPAGDRQDDARADDRRARRRRVRGALRGQRRAAGGARGDRAGARAPARRAPDDLLPRRDPPLQQGPAGRAAAGGRGGARDARRRDDREPVLRGQLGAALPHAGLRAARARAPPTSRGCCGARSTRGECGDVAVDDDAVAFLAARSGGDARAALNALELACETAARAGDGAAA